MSRSGYTDDNDNHPRERWERMRAWAVDNMKTPNVGGKRQ